MGSRHLHREGYECLVCNPNQEAWKWKHIKRKTDRDDALKLASWPRLGQLGPSIFRAAGNASIVGW